MKLSEAARSERWMTKEERAVMKRFVAAVRRMFVERGVRESPLLALRVSDVGVHWLLNRRLEQSLLPDDAMDGAPPELSGALAEQIGKARERTRKAIRDLEDACARLGAPIDVGVADKMLPLVRKTRDLLHDKEAAYTA